MRRLSRRNLLAGTGTAALVAVAGCTGGDSEDPDGDPEDPEREGETRWQEDLDVPESLVSAFAFVYSNGEDELIVGAGEQFASGGDIVGSFDNTLASADIESRAQFGPDASGETPPVVVLVGDFELESDTDGTTNGSFTVHEIDGDGGAPESDLADRGETLATNGDVLLVGDRDRVTATLDSHQGDQEPYLATAATARTILNELWGADAVIVSNSDTPFLEGDGLEQLDDVESLPTPVGYAVEEAQDTVQWQFAAGTTDERVAEDLKTVAGAFSSLDPAAFDHRVTGGILLIEAAKTFDRPREGTPPIGHPRFETYDEQTGEVLLRLEGGRSVPVENVTIEIDGEPYEGNWARGAEELGGGSQLAIDAGAIEPGDSLTITHKGEDGTSGSTGPGSLLTLLPVEFSYDPAELTATVTYRDGPPLPGERTDIRASEDAGLAESSQVDPLPDGLTKGDTIRIDDIDPGTRLFVVYERTDGETTVIGSDEVQPPGTFTLDLDDGMVTVVRVGGTTDGTDRLDEGHQPDGEPLPAERYEVRIDGVPAETQWTDQGETIEPGDTLTVGDIAAGSEVSVVWVGETTQYKLAARRVPPDITVAVSYDPAEQRLTLVHDGGESVEADALTVLVGHDEERTVSWDGDTVAEGDELTVEAVPEQSFVLLQFQGDHIFEPIPVPELTNTEGNEIVVGEGSEEPSVEDS
jgi:hypothetical protein